MWGLSAIEGLSLHEIRAPDLGVPGAEDHEFRRMPWEAVHPRSRCSVSDASGDRRDRRADQQSSSTLRIGANVGMRKWKGLRWAGFAIRKEVNALFSVLLCFPSPPLLPTSFEVFHLLTTLLFSSPWKTFLALIRRLRYIAGPQRYGEESTLTAALLDCMRSMKGLQIGQTQSKEVL